MTTMRSTELPLHLWEKVWERLESSEDIVRVGAVCKSWNSTVKNCQFNIKQHQQAPKLLLSDRSEEQQHRFYASYDATCNRMQNLELHIAYGMMRFCGSSKGWLAGVNEDYTLTLFRAYSNDGFAISLPPVLPWFRRDINEPYILDVIDLSDPEIEFSPPPEDFPHLLQISDEEEIRRTHLCDYHVETTLITADPICDPSRCFVVVVLADVGELAFTRPWEDTSWTRIVAHTNRNAAIICDMQHHDDKLYLLTCYGSVLALSLRDPTALELVAPATPLKDLPDPGVCCTSRYIVISERGELFQVLRGNNNVHTIAFLVYIWDSNRATWLEIQDLGNVSFFLGISSSICVAAPHCPPNRIYFTQDFDMANRDGSMEITDIGVYSLQTRDFDYYFGLDSHYLRKLNRQPPIWILPTIQP